MADDLENFFAKKKAAKKKGKIAQDTDDLAKRLEKAVRQQEQIDRDREEDERRERAQSESQQAENVTYIFVFFLSAFLSKSVVVSGRFRMVRSA